MLSYAFDVRNGFYAFDNAMKLACYAYPTSPYQSAALKNPDVVARKMLADKRNTSPAMAKDIEARHYDYLRRSLNVTSCREIEIPE